MTDLVDSGHEWDRIFERFLRWESASRDTIDFKTIYVDMAGDLVAGLLLSQIIFWHLPDKHGKSKLRIHRDGRYWLAKAHRDWWTEIRVTEKQARTGLDILEGKGLIDRAIFKFRGFPTTHICLNRDRFMELWQEGLGVSEKPSALEGRTEESPQQAEPGIALEGRSLTEITAETRETETTSNNNRSAGVDDSLSMLTLKTEMLEGMGISGSVIEELLQLDRDASFVARWQIWCEEGDHTGIRSVLGMAVAGIRRGDEPPAAFATIPMGVHR